ncbi:MAG: PaaI family thioesterase [Gemmatimonadaceae bacterium]|nr:PaaI family thioesterase [Gemmatimonadaceae bacterium]
MEARVRAVLAAQPFLSLLGATVVRVERGEVEIRLECRDVLLQHTGVAHAGAVTAIVDSACGAAAATLMPVDRDVVSVEFKVNLMAPAIGEYLTAIGRVVRTGRTLTVCSGEVHAVTSGHSVLVALMQATMMAVTPRRDAPAHRIEG